MKVKGWSKLMIMMVVVGEGYERERDEDGKVEKNISI